MLSGGAGRDAQIPGRDILDHEWEGSAFGGQSEVAPGNALAVWTQTAAILGAVESPSQIQRDALPRPRRHRRGARNRPYPPFGERRPPLVLLGAVRFAEGDQLEVGAIGKGDQRVVGSAASVLPAGSHGESQPGVVSGRHREIADGDDDMVDAPHHDAPPRSIRDDHVAFHTANDIGMILVSADGAAS